MAWEHSISEINGVRAKAVATADVFRPLVHQAESWSSLYHRHANPFASLESSGDGDNNDTHDSYHQYQQPGPNSAELTQGGLDWQDRSYR